MHVAEARVQGDRGQAKLDGIEKGAIRACRDDPIHVPVPVHLTVEIGVEDGFNNVNIRSSVLAGEKIIDELKVQAVSDLVPLVIEAFVGIRFCSNCVSIKKSQS